MAISKANIHVGREKAPHPPPLRRCTIYERVALGLKLKSKWPAIKTSGKSDMER